METNNIVPFWNNKISRLSKKIWFPHNNIQYKKKEFKKGIITDKYINFEAKKIKDNIFNPLKTNFKKIKLKSTEEYEKELNFKEEEKCEGEIIKNEYSKAKHNRRKAIIKKKVREFNTVTGCIKAKLITTNEQKTKLKKWFRDCNEMYNLTLNYCISNNINITNFTELRKLIKTQYKEYIKEKFNAPCCVLDDEIKNYCSNYKSCLSNIKNGNINHFKLKEKNLKKNSLTISIQNKYITKKGFYPSLLSELKINDNVISFEDINRDCKLTYDKIMNEFYIYIPHNKKIKPKKKKHSFIALDPGEKIFMTGYSQDHYVKIGEEIRVRILEYETQIRKIQRKLSQTKNNKMKYIRKTKRKKIKNMKRKINKIYKKIKGFVLNLHNKAINFLVKNYNHIIIPLFQTQNMVRKTESNKKVKETINNIKNENIDVKTKLKTYSRRCRLNRRVKFVLNNLSHYTFRQRLLHKSKEYGCDVKVVTEEYTSKTCGNCGIINNVGGKRNISCKSCNAEYHRDINGARNIFLKNYKEYLHKKEIKRLRKGVKP